VHCSLTSFGFVEGGANSVIDALLDVVGPQGTVMMPSFESSDPVFDPATSETALGAVPAALWKREGALRSPHPLASVAAIGGQARWLVDGHVDAVTAHGEGTPYHKLAEIGGKVILLGVDQDRSTFLHTAEAVARLPYLRPQEGSYRDAAGRVVQKTWQLFPGPHRSFIGLQAWLEDKGLTCKTAIGSCVAQAMDCRALLDALLLRLRSEPGIFLTDNPNLPDGIWQRAALYAADVGRESFTLAADSRCAGSTIEAVIRTLAASGIRHVLLSFLGGIPWSTIEEPWRKWYLQGLALAGIAVCGIRLPGPEFDKTEKAVSLAREAGTDTLVVPSTSALESVIAATSLGVRVLYENTGIGGIDAVHLLESPAVAGGLVAFAFDPLGFLAAGENPFLTTYSRTRIRLHTSLLYLSDGYPSGERSMLGEGLAEVAELVSMFRASRYAGLIVLQSQSPESFGENAARFRSLLHTLGRPV
jgi:aminoglycoside 3-N-acetyltransferase